MSPVHSMAIPCLPRVAVHHELLQSERSPPSKIRSRPIPLRMRTFSNSGPWSPTVGDYREGSHARHKSTSTAAVDDSECNPRSRKRHVDVTETLTRIDSPRTSIDGSIWDSLPSSGESPATPTSSLPEGRNSLEMPDQGVLLYDFSSIDYALEQATVLGKGLWSVVYLAEQKSTTPVSNSPPSPMQSRRQPRSSSALFAIKTPARQDSHPIFRK